MIILSVIIPAHNEGENIISLLQEVQEVMERVAQPWEIVVVDDASTDDTWEKLISRSPSLPLCAIQLSTQSGQTAALRAGFKAAKGEIFITLDGDLQNDPHDIPLLLEHVQHYDCVCGFRKERHDSWQKKFTSKIANSIRRMILSDDIIDTGCSLKAFKKPCLENIRFFKGAHRFLASLMLIDGYSLKQIAVSHRPRTKGKSHYSFLNRGFSTLTDLLAVRWMKKRHIPLHVEKKLSYDSK